MVSLLSILLGPTLIDRLHHRDVRRLMAVTDPRMIKGLPTILDKCKAEGFDPDAFIVTAGTSLAQYDAHVKAPMTRFYLPRILANPSTYPSTLSNRTWSAWSIRSAPHIPTRM